MELFLLRINVLFIVLFCFIWRDFGKGWIGFEVNILLIVFWVMLFVGELYIFLLLDLILFFLILWLLLFVEDLVDFFVLGFYILEEGDDELFLELVRGEFFGIFIFVKVGDLFLMLLFLVVFLLLCVFNIVVLLGWGVENGCFFFFLGISWIFFLLGLLFFFW